MPVIIGKIMSDEKTVRFNLEIHCTNCAKQVPGGIKTGEKYFQTPEFNNEVDEFLKNYLCGMCRDKKRLSK